MKKTIKELRTLISDFEKESYRINVGQNKTVQYEGLIMPIELKESFKGKTEELFAKKTKLERNILIAKKALRDANAKEISDSGKCVLDLIEENKALGTLETIAIQLSNVQKSTNFSKELGKQLTIEATYDLNHFEKEVKLISELMEKNQKLIDEANLTIESELELEV